MKPSVAISVLCGIGLVLSLSQDVWADCFQHQGFKRAISSASFQSDSSVPSTWIPAIAAAASAWNEAGSAFTFEEKQGSQNVISFRAVPNCGGARDPVACTNSSVEIKNNVRTIISTETVFNSSLSFSTSGEADKYDLQNTATHEFGHWLHLGDLGILDFFTCFAVFEQTMYGSGRKGETKKRTLEAGDVDGIKTVYPPTVNHPPTIASITANPMSVQGGGQSTISVIASDPDAADIPLLSYAWSPTCGTLSSLTGQGDKTWAAPAVVPSLGTCTVSVTVTDPAGASAMQSVDIDVTPEPSTTFTNGDRVATTDNLNVRSAPGLSGNFLGVQTDGSLGTVIGGPVFADGFWWWEINYDNGVDGWSVENFLVTPPPQAEPSFDFALGSLQVVGNIPGGFFDDFSDGSLTTLPTSAFDCLGTVHDESGGFLHLKSSDGTNDLSPGFLVDNCQLGLQSSAARLHDEAGNAVITASFRADVPLPGQAYGLQLFTLGTSEL